MSDPTPFPSLRIERDRLLPLGSFAEAQAEWLHPDAATVAELDALLRRHNVGIVAHFYMDPQLQGVLSACTWPHIHIADSLVMADRAVQMAQAGVKAVCVAGVDFMSENVRAVLDHAGFAHVDVLRLAAEPIGCSLAQAAEAPAYGAFLREAASTPHSLHVIYINTSLGTKAAAQAQVPTITCTSSNVVATLLQAAAQVPDVHVWFGPDTYMGENLRQVLGAYAQRSDAEIRAIHPGHDHASIAGLRARLHTFAQGTCVVHHLFGADVAAKVLRDHADAFLTAHLEVPGEMFTLASQAAARGRGVVGSTSNILDFIQTQVRAAVAQGRQTVLPFVLGTETGMITSIVRTVQAELRHGSGQAVDIIFPVAADAIAAAPESGLGIVPGVSSGEGCSISGGCATCPYMKMNHLDALLDAVRLTDGRDGPRVAALRPRPNLAMIAGRPVAELGSVPILHMRAFQRDGRLPDDLVRDILERQAS